jgi:cytochrome P450
MILTEGAEWRRARTLFNPGFSLTHLMTLVPSIVDDTQIFHGILSDLSESQKITPIDDLLAKLTVDIMAHIILDHDLNSQTTDNELVNAFKDAVYWTPNSKLIHPIFSLNLVRTFAQWYHARRMDNYIRKVLQDRLALRAKEGGEAKVKAFRRPAIDLAIDAYLLPDESNKELSAGSINREEFEQICIDQMKTFLFAGHDTSSSTLCYIYHMLNLHPDSLAKVRREHDEVFGTSSLAAEAIKANPKLLNELPYTTAVIKGIKSQSSRFLITDQLQKRSVSSHLRTDHEMGVVASPSRWTVLNIRPKTRCFGPMCILCIGEQISGHSLTISFRSASFHHLITSKKSRRMLGDRSKKVPVHALGRS